MIARYAHIRAQARRAAIATLERRSEIIRPFRKTGEWAQNWAQSIESKPEMLNQRTEKCMELKDFSLVGAAGFEPATTRTPSVCATRLRHAPTRG
jgi:hypothetical protein